MPKQPQKNRLLSQENDDAITDLGTGADVSRDEARIT
jgi:hypothetical protein